MKRVTREWKLSVIVSVGRRGVQGQVCRSAGLEYPPPRRPTPRTARRRIRRNGCSGSDPVTLVSGTLRTTNVVGQVLPAAGDRLLVDSSRSRRNDS